MKFLVLFPLLLSITLSQNTNDAYKRILKRINVTNAIEIRASNKTEMNNKVNAANVSESVKEWVKTSSPNKTNSKSNIDLSYDKKEGGKAKGELYYYSHTKFFSWSSYVFNYGTVDVELKPIPVLTQKKCKGLFGNRKCRDVPYSPYVSEENLKAFLNTKMREAIRKEIKKQNKTKPANNTQKKDN